MIEKYIKDFEEKYNKYRATFEKISERQRKGEGLPSLIREYSEEGELKKMFHMYTMFLRENNGRK